MLNDFATTYLSAGDVKNARTAAEESLEIDRRLAAQDPGNAQAQRDVSIDLDSIGDVVLRTGDAAAALKTYQESLAIFRKLAAQDPGNTQAQDEFVNSLGITSYAALFVRNYQLALTLADEAIAHQPSSIWLYANRAHALMMLGRADEARDLYMKYHGQIAPEGKTWDKAVVDDFIALRKAGVIHPLMDEIERDFATKPATAPQ